MPTYYHECQNEECKYCWESEYSIKDPAPTTCPKCNKETAKRMIATAVRGKVELYGQELMTKLKEDGAQLRKEAYSSEKAYANIIGESNYQKIQSDMDKNRRERH